MSPSTITQGQPLLIAGPLWSLDGFVDGWIELDGSRVHRMGTGLPPRTADHEGWVVPLWVDGHTHLGDRGLRGHQAVATATLAELVAPTSGLKHHHLATTPRPALIEQASQFLIEAKAGGTGAVWDFREMGTEGQQ